MLMSEEEAVLTAFIAAGTATVSPDLSVTATSNCFSELAFRSICEVVFRYIIRLNCKHITQCFRIVSQVCAANYFYCSF